MAAIHDPREPRMPARSRGDRAYVAIRVELASLGTAHTAGDPQWGPAPGSVWTPHSPTFEAPSVGQVRAV